MKFHPDKCTVIRISTNKEQILKTNDHLHSHRLEVVDSGKYLGVTFSEDLTWKKHINNTVNKANKTLGFIRRNLCDYTASVKAAANSTVVRPVLEYSSTVWDPHQTSDIHNLEQVQSRAAHFVYRNYTERTPGWSRVLVGSLYSIDGTQTDSLCYSESSMVWLTSLPTTFNPTTPIREVPNACGSYKQLKTSSMFHFTLVLSVTGIDCLPLLPMSRLSRNLGKASQVCLPSSCNPTRLNHLYRVLTGDLGHLPVLSSIAVFTQGNLQFEKITTLTVEEEGEV